MEVDPSPLRMDMSTFLTSYWQLLGSVMETGILAMTFELFFLQPLTEESIAFRSLGPCLRFKVLFLETCSQFWLEVLKSESPPFPHGHCGARSAVLMPGFHALQIFENSPVDFFL